eukprot:301760-Hanusia_phi.AAC.2
MSSEVLEIEPITADEKILEMLRSCGDDFSDEDDTETDDSSGSQTPQHGLLFSTRKSDAASACQRQSRTRDCELEHEEAYEALSSDIYVSMAGDLKIPVIEWRTTETPIKPRACLDDSIKDFVLHSQAEQSAGNNNEEESRESLERQGEDTIDADDCSRNRGGKGKIGSDSDGGQGDFGHSQEETFVTENVRLMKMQSIREDTEEGGEQGEAELEAEAVSERSNSQLDSESDEVDEMIKTLKIKLEEWNDQPLTPQPDHSMNLQQDAVPVMSLSDLKPKPLGKVRDEARRGFEPAASKRTISSEYRIILGGRLEHPLVVSLSPPSPSSPSPRSCVLSVLPVDE